MSFRISRVKTLLEIDPVLKQKYEGLVDSYEPSAEYYEQLRLILFQIKKSKAMPMIISITLEY